MAIVPLSIDETTVLTLGDWSNNRLNQKSLQQIITDVASKGYNSFYMPISSYSYGGVSYKSYYNIIAFNISPRTEYYLAYGTYLMDQNPTAAGSQYVPSTSYKNFAYYNGALSQVGSTPTISTKSVNNISYQYEQNQFDAQGVPVIYYVGAEVEKMYINGELPVTDIIGTGGGATHIAKVTGQLSTLSNNLSDILIVAGGGGGGLIREGTAYNGSDAGGISGNGDSSADQTTGYAFGQGESPGGGGGMYGGNKA